MDVDLDGVGAGLLVQAEDLGGQLLLAHHPPRTGDHRFQHRLFPRGQGQRLLVEAEAPGAEVVDQGAAALQLFATEHAAAQQAPDPRLQLGQFERLCQVVVGAEIEAVHPVLHLAARSQHQHRQGLAAPAQARQHLEAVHPRQADVEDRQGVLLAGQGQVGGHPVLQQVYRPAGALERLDHAFGELRMIFHQKDAHGRFSTTG